jgi:hypothetical protein
MQSSFAFMSVVLRNITKETFKSAVLKESVRSFVASPSRLNSFKVQDYKDFQERVKNSKVPVIVDFFATYVLYRLLSNIRINCVRSEVLTAVRMFLLNCGRRVDWGRYQCFGETYRLHLQGYVTSLHGITTTLSALTGSQKLCGSK